MTAFLLNDPYADPSVGVLRNLLGITDATRLATIEGEIASIRIAALAVVPLPGGYDLDHLCLFHRQIFGDVYEWAGATRSVNIQKAPVPFCNVMHIEAEADRIFALMRALEPVSDDLDVASAAAAEALGELNSLHPFREGNGRAQRAFLRQWLSEYGWSIDWEAVDPQQNIVACQAALLEVDYDPLVALIRPHLIWM